jgi:hypothetical protein
MAAGTKRGLLGVKTLKGMQLTPTDKALLISVVADNALASFVLIQASRVLRPTQGRGASACCHSMQACSARARGREAGSGRRPLQSGLTHCIWAH